MNPIKDEKLFFSTSGVLHCTTQIGEMIMLYPDMRVIGNIHDNPETKKGGQE